ncbi:MULTISPECIES: iron donor protein CyaY [Burkholderia]|jgi:CyaY protein|uniref:Iron-sulfur cluster assembly protein CyaY n=1 Tax=Burkholderia plantarii TaxID=41899 RepID=A0A0B6RRS2_BURPL|nr:MULTISPECIES: iron donor protein CyaY [Burkholderia]AJK44834.1 iron donor protein CyaY [Burkholderia plantarii]ALK29117.1 frataxin-like protein [Burkholderia plantarii]WLE57828.1 iron donor protein CyaY [Burkholderia plantarii]GLZ20917.1 protein CyaY [Burkholderia plantarii]
MSDTEYLTRAEAVLAAVERCVDEANEGDLDIDLGRNGGVITLSFENGTKIIVNLQPPMKEVWIAAKSGGYHFRYLDGAWRDTRSGNEFFAALTQYATEQAGEPVTFSA